MLILIYSALFTKALVVSLLIGGEPDKGLTSLNCSSKACTADNSSLCVRSQHAPKDDYFQVFSCEAKKSLVCRNDVVYEIIGKKCSNIQKSETRTTKKPLRELNALYVPTISIHRRREVAEGKTKSTQVKSTYNFTRYIKNSKNDSRRTERLKPTKSAQRQIEEAEGKTKSIQVKSTLNFTRSIEDSNSKRQKTVKRGKTNTTIVKPPFNFTSYIDNLKFKQKYLEMHQLDPIHKKNPHVDLQFYEELDSKDEKEFISLVHKKVQHYRIQKSFTTVSDFLPTVNYLSTKTRVNSTVKLPYIRVKSTTQSPKIRIKPTVTSTENSSIDNMIHIQEDSIKRPTTKHEVYITKTAIHKTTTEFDENQTYRPDTETYPEDTRTKRQTKTTTYHSDDEEFISAPPFTDGILTLPSDYETFTMPTSESDESQTFRPDSEAYPEDTTTNNKTNKQTKTTTYHSDDEEFSSAPPFTDGILTLPSDYEHINMPTIFPTYTNNDVYTNPPLVDDSYPSQNYQNVEGFVPEYSTSQIHNVNFNDVVCDDSPCIQEVTEPFCVKLIKNPEKFDKLSSYVIIDKCDAKRALFCNRNIKFEVLDKTECLIDRELTTGEDVSEEY